MTILVFLQKKVKELNLPKYEYKIKTEANGDYILDEIRKKYVKYTPEERVRQNLIKFLIEEKKYPKSLFAVEYKIEINKNTMRCDIVIFNKNFIPYIVVECKAPNVKISEETFNQTINYYYVLQPDYIIVTNGITHYYVAFNKKENTFKFIQEIPLFIKE